MRICTSCKAASTHEATYSYKSESDFASGPACHHAIDNHWTMVGCSRYLSISDLSDQQSHPMYSYCNPAVHNDIIGLVTALLSHLGHGQKV